MAWAMAMGWEDWAATAEGAATPAKGPQHHQLSALATAPTRKASQLMVTLLACHTRFLPLSAPVSSFLLLNKVLLHPNTTDLCFFSSSSLTISLYTNQGCTDSQGRWKRTTKIVIAKMTPPVQAQKARGKHRGGNFQKKSQVTSYTKGFDITMPCSVFWQSHAMPAHT